MKWYVADYKTQKTGRLEGMAVAGPFETRDEADLEHTRLGLDGELTAGPDDLGPNYLTNLELWRRGELE